MIPFNPGMVIHHDPRSEKFSIVAHAKKLGITAPAVPFVPRKKHWRKGWADNNQGQTSRCTAFGPLTGLSCTPIPHTGKNPLLDPDAMYAENQAYDSAHGNDDGGIDGGATTISAMETLQKHGLIRGYYWGYTVDVVFRALATKVAIAGTNWYSSMFDKDAEGIIKVDQRSGLAGGHCYCINGYDPVRGLLEIAQSWGDGSYYISADDFFLLLRDDGEFCVVDEVRV